MKDGEKIAKELIDYVNVYSFDQDDFIKTILSEHRTLQQSTVRLFVNTLSAIGHQEYFDARNEASVKLGKQISSMDIQLPLI